MKASERYLLEIRRERMQLVLDALVTETKMPAVCILDRDMRAPEVVSIRHRLWSMLHDSGMSTTTIGVLCGFDHSTVVVALQKYRHKKAVEALNELAAKSKTVAKATPRVHTHDCVHCESGRIVDTDEEGYAMVLACEGCMGSGTMADCTECDEPMPAPEAERKGWICDGCREGLERGDQAAEVERIRRTA